MLFPIFVQELDGPDAGQELIENRWKRLMEIGLVIRSDIFDEAGQRSARDDVQDTDDVVFFIAPGCALHEVWMTVHQGQNPGLFFGTAETLEGNPADVGGKALMEHQL